MEPSQGKVSQFVLHRPAQDIPQPVLSHAALLMLDMLGVCAASAPMEAGQILRDIALRLYAAGQSRDAARLLFDGRQASLPGAAFAAASQTDNLDAHDGFNPVKGHIGVAAVPALFALSEAHPTLSGREALAALVIGYEIAGRAGMALHASVSDYHTSGAWNALGVAAMAARLRGMEAETLRHALGVAEYHGPRSQMMREIAHPTMLHDGSGQGALVGLSAALMAGAGFTGAPAITVEGVEVAPFWQDLGTRWIVLEQYIKPHPICRWAHAAIDAALALCAAQSLTHEEIRHIKVASFTEATQLFAGMPTTTSQAQYSLPFAVAAAIVHGRLGVAEITGAALSDPRIHRLVAATEMVVGPQHEANFPARRQADVTLTLSDGRVLHSGNVEAKGGPDTAFTPDEIIAKFHDYADPVLGTTRARALREAVLGLSADGATLGALSTLIYPPIHHTHTNG